MSKLPTIEGNITCCNIDNIFHNATRCNCSSIVGILTVIPEGLASTHIQLKKGITAKKCYYDYYQHQTRIMTTTKMTINKRFPNNIMALHVGYVSALPSQSITSDHILGFTSRESVNTMPNLRVSFCT